MSDAIVTVSCIRHIYPDRTEVALCGVQFKVYPGQRVAVLAANGAGKTTLLQHIIGMLRPVEGEVRVFGLDPWQQFEEVRTRLGVVLQNPGEQIIGPTVREDVAFGLAHLKLGREQVRQRVDQALARLGISHLAEKVPHYLSGGEIKKVALAGVLATEPELLVLDEPFAGLDPGGVRELVALLDRIGAELGTTMIFTSHQLEPVALLADVVYVLHRGQVVAAGTPAEVFGQHQVLQQSGLGVPEMFRLAELLTKGGLNVAPDLDGEVMAQRILSAVASQSDAI